MKALFCILTALLLVGCAGTYFTFDKARQIKVGMKSAELQKIMGKPYMVRTAGDLDTWVYVYADGFGASRSVSYVLTNDVVAEVPRIPDSFGHSGSGKAIVTPR